MYSPQLSSHYCRYVLLFPGTPAVKPAVPRSPTNTTIILYLTDGESRIPVMTVEGSAHAQHGDVCQCVTLLQAPRAAALTNAPSWSWHRACGQARDSRHGQLYLDDESNHKDYGSLVVVNAGSCIGKVLPPHIKTALTWPRGAGIVVLTTGLAATAERTPMAVLEASIQTPTGKALRE